VRRPCRSAWVTRARETPNRRAMAARFGSSPTLGVGAMPPLASVPCATAVPVLSSLLPFAPQAAVRGRACRPRDSSQLRPTWGAITPARFRGRFAFVQASDRLGWWGVGEAVGERVVGDERSRWFTTHPRRPCQSTGAPRSPRCSTIPLSVVSRNARCSRSSRPNVSASFSSASAASFGTRRRPDALMMTS
jgi:hypothetical protein